MNNRLFELTERQRQIAELVADDLSNAEIAKRLGITSDTVKMHVWHILRKLGADNRHQIRALLKPSESRRADHAEQIAGESERGLSGEDVIEILWSIHGLALRKGNPEWTGMARIINQALLRLRRNGARP